MRGLSNREIEAALEEALGPEATVSRICETVQEEFDAWRQRDLSGFELDYLFVDASHFRMHNGARSELLLVAHGITTEGRAGFLHLDGVSAGQKPSPTREARATPERSPASLTTWTCLSRT